MEVRPLEIRIIKAHDLKDVNLLSKMDVYAVVSISGDQLNNPKLKTAVDKDGGTSPKWNFSMKFAVEEAAVLENRLTLKIKLISNRSLGDREIGVVYVQIKELFDNGGGGGGDEEKSGSYSVRLSNGKAKGTLDLAYKFGEKYKFEPPPPQLPPSSVKTAADAPPPMAYPSAYPGSSSAYAPPPAAYPYHAPPQGAYQPPPPGFGYPPPGYGYGGYPPPPPPGYGHPPPHKGRGGAGLGLGLGAGLLGGLLIGDMISDVGEMAAFDAGYDAGFGDAGF
ncbi:protein SRC2-like [Momordica charantia]|uniref:Protein SRC2-like n=1 Tax=Momordica charantia TaxID=3673 RepID=A0A6J1CW25_MOMCH|nr:protein SRC2-like [Momordica charantia]